MPEEKVIVPDVVNHPESDARTLLSDAHLKAVAGPTVSSTTVQAGSVTGSNPAAGATVPRDSTVTLELSSGPAPKVNVPSLIGLKVAVAQERLTGAGLSFSSPERVPDNSYPADGVISQDPGPGTLVEPQSQVKLKVSSGPEFSNGTVASRLQTLGTSSFNFFQALLYYSPGLAVLGVIGYGIIQPTGRFLKSLADPQVARGLITFLIAVATVGIAMILAISTALPQGEPGEEKEVFDRGKQVLTILIGVLGTIVGFYFGSAPGGASPNPQPTAVAESTTTLAITSTTLPDGASNTAYSATLKASGGTPPLKWSVAPPLPAGLVLDPAAGIVSG